MHGVFDEIGNGLAVQLVECFACSESRQRLRRKEGDVAALDGTREISADADRAGGFDLEEWYALHIRDPGSGFALGRLKSAGPKAGAWRSFLGRCVGVRILLGSVSASGGFDEPFDQIFESSHRDHIDIDLRPRSQKFLGALQSSDRRKIDFRAELLCESLYVRGVRFAEDETEPEG